MKICTGIDIVDIADFKRSLKNGGQNFLDRLFTPDEQKSTKIEHLAGIFAAKEAVLKALSFKPGSWQDIEVINESSGRPKAKIKEQLLSYDLSISHSKNMAIAVFVALK